MTDIEALEVLGAGVCGNCGQPVTHYRGWTGGEVFASHDNTGRRECRPRRELERLRAGGQATPEDPRDELQALCDAATPGPWELQPSGVILGPPRNQESLAAWVVQLVDLIHDADAAFIVAARSAVPSLLSRLAVVERERDEARSRLAEAQRLARSNAALLETAALSVAPQPEPDEAWEERIEYGHQTIEMGWVPEYRGIKYASHQRTVRLRLGPPLLLDHWTYADHRHPVEGCMFCAYLAAQGKRPITTRDHADAVLTRVHCAASLPVEPATEEQR